MTSASPVLSLSQVCKTYDGGVDAVRGVDLDVYPGELVALTGESGCGKTTTLKMINRLEDASGGSILYEDQPVETMDPVLLRRAMGWVMQGDGLFPHISVARNISIVPRLLRWERDRIARRVDALLEMVRLDPGIYRDRMPSELSGGQRQRVGFARALAGEPDVLLMDEPFSALDPVNRDLLQQEFCELQARLGFAAVMVTHDMAEALIMADRIAVMKEGEILQIGKPRELLDNPAHDHVSELLETPRRQMRRIRELDL
ncbi:ATP-binding cassette domain-containing protein [Maricaulis sp. D1M11]|uniref:ATP-binding cassette domain-containing protein n=1 Tax=Maricaulis sp. D1M11 TaxID=3076117 RepID=UPI0039B6D86B